MAHHALAVGISSFNQPYNSLFNADTFTGHTLAARLAFFPADVISTAVGSPMIAMPWSVPLTAQEPFLDPASEPRNRRSGSRLRSRSPIA